MHIKCLRNITENSREEHLGVLEDKLGAYQEYRMGQKGKHFSYVYSQKNNPSNTYCGLGMIISM